SAVTCIYRVDARRMNQDPDLTHIGYWIRDLSNAQLLGAAEFAHDRSLQLGPRTGRARRQTASYPRQTICPRSPSHTTLPYATGPATSCHHARSDLPTKATPTLLTPLEDQRSPYEPASRWIALMHA